MLRLILIKNKMSKFVPLRKFIFDRLYNPAGGYFCRKDFQVGELSSPIDFKALIGFDDYQQQLYKRYPKNAWLTPSEIFKPYYGMSIANYIKQAEQRYAAKKKEKNPIRIVEAGAGTGSAAESILYYFQNYEQEAYKNIQYTIVEISPILCSHIEQKLRKSFPRLFQRGQLKIINKDILKYTNPHRCYTIFLEVFDNLPHDKVVKNQANHFTQYALVNLDTNEEKYDLIQNDSLIGSCLEMWVKCQKFGGQKAQIKEGFLNNLAMRVLKNYLVKNEPAQQLFLPTYLLTLMKTIKTTLPQAHLIVSDFDSLISNIPGANAPIVSFKGEASAEKKDYSTYLVDQGAADIFFPVDFQFAQYLHSTVLQKQADILKSSDFFKQFGVDNWAVSKSGFNPLNEDFANTSFLVTKV